MVKAESLRPGDRSTAQSSSEANYDCLKEIVRIARKNRWDLESLNLVPKDLPENGPVTLGKKECQNRNRLITNVLKRFRKILTPPVPADLEMSIKSKPSAEWLPWEKEAIRKNERWRRELQDTRPKILAELNRVWPD